MGFNKRFIGDPNLFAHAKNEFDSFNTYMLKADCYFLEGEMTECFWNLYHEEREAREDVWRVLRYDGEEKDNILNAIKKAWSMSNSDINDQQLEGIINFMDLLSSSSRDEQLNESLGKISNCLKKRIKDKKQNGSTSYN